MSATTDYNAVMAALAVEDPEAHARITRVVDELLADQRAKGGPLRIICGWHDCDEVLVGHDAWVDHQRAVHGLPNR